MATDFYEVKVVADADGNGEGYTPPLDSLFVYYIRLVEDEDHPLELKAGLSFFSITVSDEETGVQLLSLPLSRRGRSTRSRCRA